MAKEKVASKAAPAAKTEKKGNNNLISVVIIIMLAILIVGVGGFAGYYIFGQKNTATNTSGSTTNSTTNDSEEIAAAYDITDEFLINLADKNQLKYLKITVSLGYDGDSKLAEELKAKESVIRDAINGVLMTKTSTDFLSEPDKITKIQDEIKGKVNPLLKKGKVIKILFRSLTIQ